MDKKQLYTVLSRITKFQYIHLDENLLLKSYYYRKLPELELMLNMTLFKKWKIYGISFDN